MPDTIPSSDTLPSSADNASIYAGCLDTSLLKRELRVDKTFLMRFFGLSDAGFEYRIRHTDFPMPVRIGKKRYWRTEQILQYLNAQEKAQTRGWTDVHGSPRYRCR